MGGLEEIVKKRLNPGILIFDMDDRLTYANQDALDILPDSNVLKPRNKKRPDIPAEIYKLCDLLKSNLADDRKSDVSCSIMENKLGLLCSLRAFLLSGSDTKNSSHIMVLIERISERREVDIEKASKDFNLSKRESEVLRLICGGEGNRGIAEKLFISEYTVKDHIKKIMSKMGAQSRSGIIALLK